MSLNKTTPPAAGRFEIYRRIHKALRACMGDTLVRVGRLDAADAGELRETLAQVRLLLDFCTSHLEHENDFIHAAMEARRPGSAETTAGDHVHHIAACQRLAALADALERRPGEARAFELYRYLALFVAENLTHMHIEETENNAVLQRAYTDAELIAIEQAIVASLTPQEQGLTMRWMIPAMNPEERAEMLLGALANMPAQAFDGMLGALKPHLPERDWDKLMLALRGEPQRKAA
jgi:hypothetical protein